jgi:hypothetical protein
MDTHDDHSKSDDDVRRQRFGYRLQIVRATLVGDALKGPPFDNRTDTQRATTGSCGSQHVTVKWWDGVCGALLSFG